MTDKSKTDDTTRIHLKIEENYYEVVKHAGMTVFHTDLSFLFKDVSTECLQPLQKFPLVSSVSEKLKEIKEHWFERWKLRGR